jgi:hypothetical protein
MNRERLTGLLAAAAVAAMSMACGPGGATSSAPGSASAGTPATASSGAAAPLGTWTTTISPDDLRAAGFTEMGVVTENSGTFTMTVDADGTWTQVQQTEPAPRWPVFRGTWAATDDDGLELRTTFPADYAGDVVSVAWQIEQGSLRLQLVAPDDPLLRANLESHRWQPAP